MFNVAKGESKLSIIAAVTANILIGAVKFMAAGISGSAAMFSEGIHSFVDSGNGLLLLYGLRKSEKRADLDHPFGYGKELYFWTLVVSILVFSIGGGMSAAHGYEALLKAHEGTYVLGDPTLNYAILLIAMVLEGASLLIAVRQFNKLRRAEGMGAREYIRECKDPSLYAVVLEDTAAEIGLIIAFAATFLGHMTGNLYVDGIASIMIGAVLIVVAAIIMKESMGLLVGEGVNLEEIRQIEGIVKGDPAVAECGAVLTNYFGPHDLLVSIDATFKPSLDLCEVLDAVDRIENSIKKDFPEATRVFVEAKSLACVRGQRRQIEKMIREEEEDS